MSTLYSIILLLALSACVALISAFSILLLAKLGARDLIIAKAPKLISDLFQCDFCLNFWISFILASISALYFGRPIYFIIPIFSTPLGRFLI